MKKCKKHNVECAYNTFTFLGYKCCIAESDTKCINGELPVCLEYTVNYPCPYASNSPCKIKGNCACEFIRNRYNSFMYNHKLPMKETKTKIENSFFGMDV